MYNPTSWQLLGIFQPFPTLQSSNLSSNELIELPESLGCLLQLKILSARYTFKLFLTFSSNQLHHLPTSLSNLTNLTHLQLSNNNLIDIPQSILNLPQLEQLILGVNKIEKIPTQWHLIHLSSLDLAKNKLVGIHTFSGAENDWYPRTCIWIVYCSNRREFVCQSVASIAKLIGQTTTLKKSWCF